MLICIAYLRRLSVIQIISFHFQFLMFVYVKCILYYFPVLQAGKCDSQEGKKGL
jgi:hypothetical protein